MNAPLSTTAGQDTPVTPPEYVYEFPVRIWHWVITLAIFVLSVTGYFIAKPLPTMAGEASDFFVNGWMRYIHFVASYVLAVFMVLRYVWAFIGNHHAREIFIVPFWDRKYLKSCFDATMWYALIRKEAPKHLGHSPIARISMLFIFNVGLVVLMVTGFGLYSEGTAEGSWSRALFGWTIGFAGSSMDLRLWHHFAMYYLWLFILAHLYLVIREDIMGRASMTTTMITGWRHFRDGKPDLEH